MIEYKCNSIYVMNCNVTVITSLNFLITLITLEQFNISASSLKFILNKIQIIDVTFYSTVTNKHIKVENVLKMLIIFFHFSSI